MRKYKQEWSVLKAGERCKEGKTQLKDSLGCGGRLSQKEKKRLFPLRSSFLPHTQGHPTEGLHPTAPHLKLSSKFEICL